MLRMWYTVHDYVRHLLTETPENNVIFTHTDSEFVSYQLP